MDITAVIFIVYLSALIGVGIWTFRLNKTQEDYLLAGRKLGPWVTAFSERASGESAWLILALPGAAIASGLSQSWTVLGIILGSIASWYLIAERLREQTAEYGALTLPEFLHRKYNDKSNIIRLFSALIIAFFFTFYVSAQFHASGKVLNTMFDLDPLVGISIGALVITGYTLMGGFYAVAWTDLVQGMLMIGTLIILPLAGFIEITGNPEMSLASSLEKAGPHHSSYTGGQDGFAAFAVVMGGLSWGLGYLGQPHLLIRYMAIRSVKEVKIARRIAVIWTLPGITGSLLIGLAALTYFGPGTLDDVEKAMPLLATELLPAVIAGLFISGAVAAMMSTADSQMLVSTSAITEDFVHQFLGRKLTERNLVTLSRITIIGLGVFAYGLALYSQLEGKNIFSVVSYAWSGLGSAFGPALVLTLWWKNTTRKGVIAGLLTGFLTTVVWSNIAPLQAMITERFVSFVFAFAAVLIVSKLDSDGK